MPTDTPSPSASTPRHAAIVTGASRGIGRAIAQALGSLGAGVVVNYLGNQAAAQETAELVEREGGRAVVVQADIALAADRARLVDAAVAAFGGLTLLVNNAGVPAAKRCDLLDITEESYDQVMGVNLRGPFFLSQLAAKAMLAGRATWPPGLVPAIVNIGSISAYAASPERGQYCVAKAGLAMCGKLFAARLAAEGVLVCEVRPGIIDTDMARRAKEKYDRLILQEGLLPQPRWGQPEDVALAVKAIAEGRFPYSPGAVIDVDGGFNIRRL